MLFLEKVIVNDYIYFVVRKDNKSGFFYDIKDFFLFSEKDYMPIFQNYIFNIIQEILETNFYKKKYSKRKMKIYLQTYSINVLSNHKIDFTNSFFFKEALASFQETEYEKDKKYLCDKKSIEGIKTLLDIAFKRNIEKNVSKYSKVEKLCDFFASEKRKDVEKELVKLYLCDAYEKGKSSMLTFKHESENKISHLEQMKDFLIYLEK